MPLATVEKYLDQAQQAANGATRKRRRGVERLPVRFMARSTSVGFLALTICYGLITGGHLDDPRNPLFGLPGQVAGYFGYAAQSIHVSGLERQRPETVLKAIGVVPDGPLIGFSARRAKRLLENIDWVASAKLRRVHPNGLEIEIRERVPFAIWQRGGARYVIDESGIALSTLDPDDFKDLLLVTGEGAQSAAAQLVNHIEGDKALKSHVKAAARVGQRRWTLYMDNGLRVALAERDVAGSLARLATLVKQEKVFDKAVEVIDLRLPDRTVVTLLPEQPDKTAAKEKNSRGG